MAITTLDGIVNAFATARQKTPIAKVGLSAQLVGGTSSLWRSVGNPPQGVMPTVATTCNASTVGGIPFTQPTGGATTYIARLMLGIATAAATAEIHDRLAHITGLNATLTTAQTVGIDLNAMGSTDNIAQRKGRADYSTVQWWLEGSAQTGGTAVTLFVSYTNHLGVSGTTSLSLPATYRIGQMTQILPQNPGEYIRSIESVTLTASTGSQGNWGIVATVQRTEITMPMINVGTLNDWSQTGFPPVYDNSCLFFIINVSNGNVGAINGAITLIQG